MKRFIIAGLASAALVLGGGATAALAGTSPNSSPVSSSPGHFSYVDGFYGQVSCNEVHHPSNTLPASEVPAGAVTTGGYDTVTCHIASGAVPNSTLFAPWLSDFGSQFDNQTGLINILVSSDGTVYHAVAWYPNG